MVVDMLANHTDSSLQTAYPPLVEKPSTLRPEAEDNTQLYQSNAVEHLDTFKFDLLSVKSPQS